MCLNVCLNWDFFYCKLWSKESNFFPLDSYQVVPYLLLNNFSPFIWRKYFIIFIKYYILHLFLQFLFCCSICMLIRRSHTVCNNCSFIIDLLLRRASFPDHHYYFINFVVVFAVLFLHFYLCFHLVYVIKNSMCLIIRIKFVNYLRKILVDSLPFYQRA